MNLGSRVALTLFVAGCGSAPAPEAPRACSGERPSPNIHVRHAPPSGGANAYFEFGSSHVEPVAADNHVFLDESEIPITRSTITASDEQGFDATAGQLTPHQAKAHAAAHDQPAPHGIIGFRIPAGIAAGAHRISFRTCGAASEETLAYEVLAHPAAIVSGVRVVKGAVWSSLLITGSNLANAEEVVLVSPDGAVITLSNVTRIDDGQLKVALEKSGSYDVFVRSPNGLGGGPPGGVVVVR